MKKQKVVHLRVYRGKSLNYDANGNITTENWSVKLIHDIPEYHLFLKNMRPNGYIHVEVENVTELVDIDEDGISSYQELKDISQYQKEVENAFKIKAAPLTDEQKRIAELEATIKRFESMMNGKGGSKQVSEEASADDSDELASVQAEYERVLGKKPHHLKTIDKLKQEIKAAKP